MTSEQYTAKQTYLSGLITNRKIRYNWHDSYLSTLEGVIARGDRRVADLIYTAWKKGCRFDAWSDYYREDLWKEALEECHIELRYYNYRERPYDEILPWDMINYGVTKRWLQREYERAKQGLPTIDCGRACSGCGMMAFARAGLCFEERRGSDES